MNAYISLLASRSIIEIGKLQDGGFSVDYRKPMCAVQAFAVFLSACNWIGH